jgi:hypothetical protein
MAVEKLIKGVKWENCGNMKFIDLYSCLLVFSRIIREKAYHFHSRGQPSGQYNVRRSERNNGQSRPLTYRRYPFSTCYKLLLVLQQSCWLPFHAAEDISSKEPACLHCLTVNSALNTINNPRRQNRSIVLRACLVSSHSLPSQNLPNQTSPKPHRYCVSQCTTWKITTPYIMFVWSCHGLILVCI